MGFMTNFSFDLMAHELAHQWFGDKVTCGGWQDIWLNEGFATYFNALCYQYIDGQQQYWSIWKNQTINNVASQPDGSVFVDDTTDINRLFNGTAYLPQRGFVAAPVALETGR
jgi:aminopeptidase N